MEIFSSRTGEHLVLSLSGRMDGTGAQQATAALQQNLTDHDTALIFDLGGVDYLSSAGLRVFQESARRMKERNGRIAVCRPQEFVRKLFTSGGFFRILAEFPTVEDALAGTAAAPAPGAGGLKMEGPGWTLTAERLSGTPGTLAVTGSLGALHDGAVGDGDVKEAQLLPGGFATGIGAMAATREAASPLLGEMVQAGGTVYWIPTDGNATPDFFTREDLETSGMRSYTLFSAAFSGPFSDVLRITSDKPGGMSIAELYDAVFRFAGEQYPEFPGACIVCMKATIGGVSSADLRTSVLAAAQALAAKGGAGVPAGKTVTEYPFPENSIDKASAVDIRPRYAGEILISIGYGIDRAAAEKRFGPEQLAAVSYSDPRTSGAGRFLYNKGLVFSGLPWDNARPFEDQFRAAPDNGRFVALHNLLAATTVKSAIAGILPVKEIRTVG